MADIDKLADILGNVTRCFEKLSPPFQRLQVSKDLDSLYEASLQLEQVAVELQIEASRMKKWCEENGAGADKGLEQ
ncbi:MAG: hypothetical protein A4E32_00602 [Methanomassiliicoccales archaeon PtaU1.Bin124]|nr:MAG: hypothetical protein A4E32_00602 [Methanomassiliicoccales archaeon PtaU1.Bin124]